MASSLGMVEADPVPGPSLALRDDMAGWPGAIVIIVAVHARFATGTPSDEVMNWLCPRYPELTAEAGDWIPASAGMTAWVGYVHGNDGCGRVSVEGRGASCSVG